MSSERDHFAPIVHIDEPYWVFNFTRGPDPHWVCPYDYQIGRYDEVRPGMYLSPLFEGERDLHVGIDIGAPAGTPVHSFSNGRIHAFDVNEEEGSYGPTIIVEYELSWPPTPDDEHQIRKIWALYGHLSTDSLEGLVVGSRVAKGQCIASIGTKEENGGWEPHVHFQLALDEPTSADLPGVVRRSEREQALEDYPDPRLVLGPLY
ncbi:MAG: peptidoglycan DD-metalloendopeptidase family protein [Candidatus Poseidoniaceae archaeon]